MIYNMGSTVGEELDCEKESVNPRDHIVVGHIHRKVSNLYSSFLDVPYTAQTVSSRWQTITCLSTPNYTYMQSLGGGGGGGGGVRWERGNISETPPPPPFPRLIR